MAGFELTEELKMIRDQVRRIVAEDVMPAESRVDPDAADIAPEDYERISKKARDAGLWHLGVAEKYGGGGLNTFEECVIREEMCQHRMGLYNQGCGVFGRPIPVSIWAGSEEQIQQYAVTSIQQAHTHFFAITEAGGGSDPANAIQCRAVRKGDTYILNGTKMFISNAHISEWGVLYARTDPDAGRKGISCFIIEKDMPGFSAKPIRVIRDASVPCEVTLEDCEVPAGQLIGEEGQGLFLAFDLLVKNRFPYSAANVAIAVAAHKRAVAYANQRHTFGEYLAERQAIQWMLADNEMDIRTARWLTWEGAWKADRGEDARVEASIAKCYTSEALGRVIDRVVQIHGSYGVSKEFPFERWYREARVRRIGEGPSEVHRMVIARELLREGREERKREGRG